MKTAREKYPELSRLAEAIANDTCRAINERAPKVESEMPYKTQCVLEMVIEILQARV
jgi:hypothetical protein